MRFEKEPFLFRAIPWIIGIVFIVIVLFLVAVGILAVSVWCGAGGCK